MSIQSLRQGYRGVRSAPTTLLRQSRTVYASSYIASNSLCVAKVSWRNELLPTNQILHHVYEVHRSLHGPFEARDGVLPKYGGIPAQRVR